MSATGRSNDGLFPPVPLTEDQAMEWALRIGEYVRTDRLKRGPQFWALTLGLKGEQLEQVMHYFEKLS